MVRVILFLGLLFPLSNRLQAQTWSEWFRQKSTQKKYLLQQIAALQVYIDYAAKGYEIAGKGINTVRHIKNGDFNLHRDFFNSLKDVNPTVEKGAKVADIIACQGRILKIIRQALLNAKSSERFTGDEIAYCKKVSDFLMSDCAATIDFLIQTVTSGDWQMKDDERLKRIDELYADMQNKYAFASSFRDELKLLSAQRLREQTEVALSKSINGVK